MAQWLSGKSVPSGTNETPGSTNETPGGINGSVRRKEPRFDPGLGQIFSFFFLYFICRCDEPPLRFKLLLDVWPTFPFILLILL